MVKFKSNLLIYFLISSLTVSSQTATNDPNWNLIQGGSEEFNGTNSTLFPKPTGNSNIQNHTFWAPNAFFDPSFPTDNGTVGALHLQFTANDVVNIPPQRVTGAAWTNINGGTPSSNGLGPPALPQLGWGGGKVDSDQRYPFHYGYYELRFRMPYYVDPNTGLPTQLGLIPQFWMSKECWCGQPGSTYCPIPNSAIDEEIDIMEGIGWANKDFEIHTHWYYQIANCPIAHRKEGVLPNPDRYHQTGFYNPTTDYIRLGMEWLPNYMKFYVNDQLYTSTTNPSIIPSRTMTVWIDLASTTPAFTGYTYPLDMVMPNAPVYSSPNPNNTLDFIVDYFRYYKLKTGNCNNDYNILTNNDVINFPNELYKNIRVGIVGNETVDISNNSSVVLRHSGDFEVICDFEVQSGSELIVIPTACH